MKSIVIVTTYPKYGSKNIGDRLITNSLIEVIKQCCEAKTEAVWRADNWDKVSKIVLSADHIIFACLAIRPQMHKKEYPFLENIIKSEKPFSVIAAGTALPVKNIDNLFAGFSNKTIELLHKINSKSRVFTTRGWLTQEFCGRIGLNRAVFNGDVAFFNGNTQIRFTANKTINKVVISDPHMPNAYLKPLNHLYSGLCEVFPEANITILLHGVNGLVEKYAKENRIECKRIYENVDSGLIAYEEADLHVGFRVHGHVSALSRGKYSYLLEQDGRGCDYGITIDRKISISNYLLQSSSFTLRDLVRLFLFRPKKIIKMASTAPVDQVIALIKKDYSTGFDKFVGLEKQIETFNDKTKKSVANALLNTPVIPQINKQ